MFLLGWVASILVGITVLLARLLKTSKPTAEPSPALHQPPSVEPQPVTPSPASIPIEPTKEPPASPFWDVVGLTSVAVTIAGAAIFYIAGWFYEAHWYGYYNLEISQMALLPHQVMVQGFPGIFLVLIGLIVSITWQYFSNALKWLSDLVQFKLTELIHSSFFISESQGLIPKISQEETHKIILRAYIWSYLLLTLFIIAILAIEGASFPWEILITLVSGGVITVVVRIISDAREIADLFLSMFLPEKKIKLGTKIRYFLFWLPIELSKKGIFFGQESASFYNAMRSSQHLLEKIWAENANLRDKTLLLFQTAGITDIDPISPDNFFKTISTLLDRTIIVITERLSRFWLPLVVLLLFLLSISASSAFGEFDALRGARSLSGNWQMPLTYLFSSEKIFFLSQYEDQVQGGFQYGPFGLVSSTSTDLYLTNWKITSYFKEHPSLYVIPVKPEQSFRLGPQIPLPSLTPTPISTLTFTPTSTSTITPFPTLTPTPSPLSTILTSTPTPTP